jgi:hypothetical protein
MPVLQDNQPAVWQALPDLPVYNLTYSPAAIAPHLAGLRGHAKEKWVSDEAAVAAGALYGAIVLHPDQRPPAAFHPAGRGVGLAAAGAFPTVALLLAGVMQVRPVAGHRSRPGKCQHNPGCGRQNNKHKNDIHRLPPFIGMVTQVEGSGSNDIVAPEAAGG